MTRDLATRPLHAHRAHCVWRATSLGVAALALVLAAPAWAGFTLIEKDYVGNVENLNKVGGGDASAATPDAARFAGSNNRIAEGPPPGASEPNCVPADGDPGDPGCVQDADGVSESFVPGAPIPVQGPQGTSTNGWQVFSNEPTCPEIGKQGFPQSYTWTIELERQAVSDLQLQICLDVRKCQEEDDRLGPSSTISMFDYIDGFGWEAPVLVEVVHLPGPLNPIQDRRVPNLRVPTLEQVPIVGPFVDLPHSNSPDDFEEGILEESVAFIGRDCISKWVVNDGWWVAQDRLQVTVHIPSSTRVRVRAAADSAALCYVGTPLPGECDVNPENCGL